VKDKRGLVRVVRTREGNIEVDSSGKKAGRGAYLCPSKACWEAALKDNKLEHALKGSLTQANREQLAKYGEESLKGVH
jgi:predicted RNA-binding protein YlxR (DUF448 family)